MDLKLVISVSYAISLVIAIFVLASKRPRWEKTLLIVVLIIPLIGLPFFLLVSGMSRRLLPDYDGKGAGLGRRYLDGELAKSANTPVYWDDHLKYLEEELRRMDQRNGRLTTSKKKKNK